MHRVHLKLVPVVVAWAVLLGALLFSDYWVAGVNTGWTRTVALEIRAAGRDPGMQWMIVLCLTVYFVTFLLIEGRGKTFGPRTTDHGPQTIKAALLEFGEKDAPTDVGGYDPKPCSSGWQSAPSEFQEKLEPIDIGCHGLWGRFRGAAFVRGQGGNPNFWLAAFLLLVLVRYAVDYTDAVRSLQVVVLLTGIVVGKAAGLLSSGLRVLRPPQYSYGGRASSEGVSPESALSSPESKVQSPESGPLSPESQAASSEPQTSVHQATHHASRITDHTSRTTPDAPSSIVHRPSSAESQAASRTFLILGVLTLLLAGAAFWQPGTGMEFQYRGVRRWTGPWNNPNIYGLLMGVGVVLALGLFFVSSLKSQVQSQLETKCRGWEYVTRLALLVMLFAAAGLCAYGLLKSFSRGAWLGTAVGIAYLFWKRVQSREPRRIKPRTTQHASWMTNYGLGFTHYASRFTPRFSRLSVSVAVLLLSLLVICFWQFRHTEAPLARRVFSAANPNDFSWRNRVTVWGGSIRMTADHPWWGVGWGRVETRFAQDYRPPRLEETMAVQLNDYFMLAKSAGLPALFCFLACLVTTFRNRNHGLRTTDHGPRTTDHASRLPSLALAAVIVLLVGFWFDGGLFKLPTAVVFGTLLALAISGRLGGQMDRADVRCKGPQARSSGCQSAPSESGQKLEPIDIGCYGAAALAALAALGALALTALHLGAPQLSVHERSVRLARQWLVPAHEREDFDFLIADVDWSGSRLRTPLQHAHLAHYNRQLVNWRVEDTLYQRYVLAPVIDPARDGDRHWRRGLWEHYYPRVRRESHPAAAEIIARDLRERVIVSEAPEAPRTIAESWRQQRSDADGWQALYVAALRSVGVPARLASAEHAEFHDGANWRPAPRGPHSVGK